MTIIIGYKENDKLYFGADSQTTSGSFKYQDTLSKVFIKDGILFGCAGNIRGARILRYNFDIPEYENHIDLYEYMNVHFIPALRKTLRDNAYSEVIDSVERIEKNSILVGIKGRIFKISSDYCVSEIMGNYVCIGSGMEYAYGSLYSLEDIDGIGTTLKIESALSAACKFDKGCAPPFKIISN